MNPEHPRGKHKARVFATLGFTAENADDLRAALLNAAATNDAQEAASDQFGDRYLRGFEINVAYEVEFSDDEGKTYAELALQSDQLPILHHRPLRAA